MMTLTRNIDCPTGKQGQVTIIAGYLSTRQNLEIALSYSIGWPANELVIDRTTGNVTHASVIVAVVADVPKP